MIRFLLRGAFCLLGIAGLWLTGCATADYSENAVERARSYALDNLRGLTETQMHFIKFTQPEIYSNTLFPRYAMQLTLNDHIETDKFKDIPTSPQLDYMHSCVVWSPPDLGAKVIVIGEGERSMRFWRPYRVVVKDFHYETSSFDKARDAAAKFIQNNMPYLSDSELNRVRFGNPEVVYSRLEVDEPTPSGRKSGAPSAWEEYQQEKKNVAPQRHTQISLAWEADDPERRIVATGFSTSGGLPGWRIQSVELMPASKLNAARLSAKEIADIPKKPEKGGLIFPKEVEPNRNPSSGKSSNAGISKR